MTRIALVVIFIFPYLLLFGQKTPQLHILRTTQEIVRDYNNGLIGPSKAAQDLALINKIYLAEKILKDENYIIAVDSSSIVDFSEMFNAIKESRITVINEAHHKPYHRKFVNSILDSLYSFGYRYLALESLTNHFADSTKMLLDQKLNERGYPLFSPLTGSYTKEPEMGKLIRNAIKMGFTLVGYEKIGKGEREFVQANNIYRKVIKSSDKSKVVILCGYSHVRERSKDKKWMAQYLSELSGIDPVTINQTYTIIGSSKVELLNSEKLTQISDLDLAKITSSDFHIGHPAADNIKNRSFRKKENVKMVDIGALIAKSKSKFAYPIICKIYLHKEESIATPIKIFEIKSENIESQIYLDKDSCYRLEIDGVKDFKIDIK